MAVAVRQGSESEIRIVTDLLLQSGGVDPAIAEAFDFRERLVRAEIRFRQKKHKGITDMEITTALNGLAGRLALPEFARTSPSEVRRLRMRLLPLFPQLMISETPGRAIDDEIGPMEAIFITAALVLQKVSNPDFQLTVEERDRKKDKSKQQPDLSHRSGELNKAIAYGTAQMSLRDLLLEGEALLDTLGIESMDGE
jgi:hypothetical protein